MGATVTISLVGALFAAVCGVQLLISPRFRTDADRLFGALALLTALALLAIASDRAGLAAGHRWINRVDFLFALGVGPLLYLYERALADPSGGLARIDLVHAVPVAAAAMPFFAWSWWLIDWMVPFPAILAVQLVYVWRAAVAYRRGRRGDPPPALATTCHLAQPAIILVALVNAGQIVRVFPPTRALSMDIVPFLASAGFLMLPTSAN